MPGLLSYREDNEKLYVNNGNRWDEIGSEKEVAFPTNIKPRTGEQVFLDVCTAKTCQIKLFHRTHEQVRSRRQGNLLNFNDKVGWLC